MAEGSRGRRPLSCAVSFSPADAPGGRGVLSIAARAQGHGGLLSGEREGIQGPCVPQHHGPGRCGGLGAQGVLRGQDIARVHVPGGPPLLGRGAGLLRWVRRGLRAGGRGVGEVPVLGWPGCCHVETRPRGRAAGATPEVSWGAAGGRCGCSTCRRRAGHSQPSRWHSPWEQSQQSPLQLSFPPEWPPTTGAFLGGLQPSAPTG